MRLAIVSHSLVQEWAQARWQRLAEISDVETFVVVPSRWESTAFGNARVWEPAALHRPRYQVVPVPTLDRRRWWRYVYRSWDAALRRVRPDVILVYEEELTFALQQLLLYRDVWAPRAKLGFFSWNNLSVSRAWAARLLFGRVRRGADFAIVGNSEAGAVLRSAGFHKEIHLQTEIGVDEAVFRPDAELRARTRTEMGLSGFVVGFAGRVVEAKGILDLAAACAGMTGDWTLLVVGDGAARGALEGRFAVAGLTGRLRITGEADLAQVPRFLSAMDCLVLPSRTTPEWKEQFGLVLAQAMSSGVPVVGSDSGAIPEVIGDAGGVFREGDAAQLREILVRVMTDLRQREDMRERGLRRCRELYSVEALARDTLRLLGLVTSKVDAGITRPGVLERTGAGTRAPGDPGRSRR